MRIALSLSVFVLFFSNAYSQACDSNWIHSFLATGRELDGGWIVRVSYCTTTLDPLPPEIKTVYRNPTRNICIDANTFNETTTPTLKSIKCDPFFNWQTELQKALDDIIVQLNSCVCHDPGLGFSASCDDYGAYPPIKIIGVTGSGAFGSPGEGEKIPGKLWGGYIQEYDGSYIVPEVWVNVAVNRDPSAPWCWTSDCSTGTIGGVPCVSIQAVLLHEILHGLGLAHINGISKDGKSPCFDALSHPCADLTSCPECKSDPMWWNLLTNTTDPKKISCRNQCALRMLYCPVELSPSLGKKAAPCCSYTSSSRDIADTQSVSSFELYPNSAIDLINLRLNDPSFSNCTIKIVDTAGRLFLVHEVRDGMIPVLLSLNVTNVPQGGYFLIVHSASIISSSYLSIIR